jgi:hypothetical protein
VYVVCNIWTSWLTLIPGSLLLGLVSAPLWTAVRTYMSALARVKVDQDMVAKPKQVWLIWFVVFKLKKNV